MKFPQRIILRFFANRKTGVLLYSECKTDIIFIYEAIYEAIENEIQLQTYRQGEEDRYYVESYSRADKLELKRVSTRLGMISKGGKARQPDPATIEYWFRSL